ncbi:MAG TPA: hypothetical protein PKL97_09430 [Candidatus Omnitrophota bacterium]|nr:hypothetical protein [Candidatus Omnitrophota bacterium]
MLSGRTRILDFDGSLILQKELLRRFSPQIADLRALGPSVRLWSDAANAERIRSVLRPEEREAVTFLGSGDFHHITSLLLDGYREPLTVISFDHHPDWDIFPPKLGCGSWVSRALEKDWVKKIILLGMASVDLSSPFIESGNWRALKHDRLEIYPYAHEPSKVFFRNIPENNSVETKKAFFLKKVFWRELKGKDPVLFFEDLLRRIPTREVYVTIDKDCLRSSYALTNWEEGAMGIDELLRFLRLIRENLDIVGLDITGDYSFPKSKGIARRIYARWNHPLRYSARSRSQEAGTLVNETVNLKILETLFG